MGAEVEGDILKEEEPLASSHTIMEKSIVHNVCIHIQLCTKSKIVTNKFCTTVL